MIIPVGSFINAGAIILGSTIGLFLGNRLTDDLRKIVFQGLGLCVMIIGMQMALLVENPLILIFSILIGGILGEIADLEGGLTKCGNGLKLLMKSGDSKFTDGFVTATMIFCIGSMAILGPLDEGLTGDRTVLFTKSLLDAFAGMALSAAMGTGVIFSAIPVIIYQGIITIFAGSLQSLFTDSMILNIKATGGVMILGISLNMLELTKIRLTNLLPALFVTVLLVYIIGVFA
ncbi:DUF554 domain-containing protein [Desulfovibrio sp. OttesenSCG-928-F07]|nr:DUF554 domain-containing protein [Desulfovibrio sp. OttesenSCG-928-F07]